MKRFKFCRKCEVTKPVEDYYIRATGRLEAWCKPCTIKDANGRKAEKRRLAREERAARPAPPPPTRRQCKKCRIVKPISDFQHRTATTWLWSCKVCVAAYREAWLSRPGTREAISIRARENAEANRMAQRMRRLARYGITPEEYDARYDAQRGECLICGAKRLRCGEGKPGGTDVLAVDHHHGTGQVRGLLCTGCNTGLGCMGDDVARLTAAIQYLRQGEPNGSQEQHAPGGDSGGV